MTELESMGDEVDELETTQAQRKRDSEKKGEGKAEDERQEEKKEPAGIQPQLAYHFESKITDPQLTQEAFQHLLNVQVPKITVK